MQCLRCRVSEATLAVSQYQFFPPMVKIVAYGLLCGVFIASGLAKVQNPTAMGQYILGGGLPKALKMLDVPVPFGPKEAELLALVTGVLMLACSAMIVLGVMRQVGAALLAFVLFNVTVFQHINIEDPAKTPQDQVIQALKNASIIGALLLVSQSGGGSTRKTATPAAPSPKKKQ